MAYKVMGIAAGRKNGNSEILLKDRTTVAGRARHLEEIAQTQGGFFSDPEKVKLVQERKAAYAKMHFKGIDE